MRPIDADAFKEYIDAQEGRPFIGCTVGEAMKILIDEQPTVQPEPMKGEWSDGYRWQRCSLCKQTGKKSWNYCPNCGAKMTISK